MSLIDTHTHLESFARRGDLADILKRARESGVTRMITIGTAPDDWSLYRDLAREHEGTVEFSVGLHPCSVDETWASALAQMEAFWSPAAALRPVALGEIGLDRFHLPQNDPERAEQIFGWQQEAFREGLRLAKRLDCPVVVHSRGAFQECLEVIDQSGVDWTKVVFHCFVEGEAEMRQLMERGGYGSFTGILTYKSADTVRAAAKAQGLERFMLETDAPYLTPMPHRGKPNEPGYVRHTAEYAAGLFGVNYDELSRVSSAVAGRFFGLR